ncbi:MAG: DNA repair protein RecO [Evtepia sp.]
MEITTKGIVLRETNYKDADKILTVLTQDFGKCTIKAAGCRRKNNRIAAAAQLLVYSELTLNERHDRYLLKEAFPLSSFRAVREDFILLSLASYFSEILDATAQENLPDPPLLSLLLNALYALDQLKKSPAMVKAVFEWKLLALIGYEPRIDTCAVCGQKNPSVPRFHLREGILHCAHCPSPGGISMPLTPSALQAARYLLRDNGKHLFSFSLDETSLRLFGDTSEAFLLTQLERGFHTLDFYKRETFYDRII